MKNTLLFFLLLFQSILFSQTVLNTFPINLKNPEQNGQILTAQNTTTQDVFAFITDSKSVTLLQYNKTLFLNNQLAASRLNVENKTIIGYSFGEDQQPTLYWSSDDFKIIVLTKYDMVNKTLKASKFSFPESTQELISTFQKNNSFYILSKDKTAQALTLYSFKNDSVVQKSLDFSNFPFQNKNTQFVTFNQFIRADPIEKMEANDYNPLSKTVQKSKVYMADNRLILSFDQNSKRTQLFEINLDTYEIKEKNFLQAATEKPKKNSGSFYLNDKLYQINATDEELLLDIKDYNTEKTIKSVKISKLDTIQFKNSPLFIQIEDRKPREIKKTSVFLKQLSGLDIGISAFKSRQNTYITIGGTPKYGRPYYSYFDDYGNLQMNFASFDQMANVYFESILDQNSEFIQEMQMPFAMDNIYHFLSENKKISVQNTLTLKNYSILSYYDSVTKQFIMRKFTDGFFYDEPGNPIMDKSILSQPFQFEKP